MFQKLNLSSVLAWVSIVLLLSFLYLQVYDFCQIWKVLSTYFFEYLSAHLLFLSFLRLEWTRMLEFLLYSLRSLRFCSFLFCFCSFYFPLLFSWVISILDSNSLTLSTYFSYCIFLFWNFILVPYYVFFSDIFLFVSSIFVIS